MGMLYNKSPIMWKSKMQKTMAPSTAEAEYYSAFAASCEFLYLRALLHRLEIKQKMPSPISKDNTACIEWGKNAISGCERAKHIDIRKPFSQRDEVIQYGVLLLVKVPTEQQLKNILTKRLHLLQVLACIDELLGWKSNPSTFRTSVLKRGYGEWRAKTINSSHVGP
jgi:hypothetical protein